MTRDSSPAPGAAAPGAPGAPAPGAGRRSHPGQDLLVGVDIGTTSTKATVVTTEGDEVARAKVATPWRLVGTGAEAAPDGFVGAALAAVSAALSEVPAGQVLSIGIASIAETGVLVGPSGEPVAPAIAWHDTRGAGEAASLSAEIGSEHFSVITGLPLSPLCSLAKYAWARANVDGATGGVHWFSIAEWVVSRLGGARVSELSLASRTGMLDVPACSAFAEALEWAGAPPGLLGDLVGAGAPLGRVVVPADIAVDETCASRIGGAGLTVAGHDHQAASIGAGVVDHAGVFDSCGTAEAWVRAVKPPLPAAVVLHCLEGHVTVGWHAIGGHLVLVGSQRAGLGLQRFLDMLGVGPGSPPPPEREALEDAALHELRSRPEGGIRVEGVSAEKATLVGIGRRPSPGEVWKAAVQAVARRSVELLSAVVEVSGSCDQLVSAGGWTRSRALRAAKDAELERWRATVVPGVIPCPGAIAYPAVEEAGARGAALLGGVAAGAFASLACVPPPR
ncbi:MAG: FGGY-family carbohydrate kinase [Acidimicrobiales bacterium]